VFRKRRSVAKPRFFVYVSDAKVDMLLSQIPEHALSRIAAEITVDVKILRVKLSQAGEDRSRFDRALAATRFLEESDMVGEVDSPSMYVRAESLPMRWGRVAQQPGVSRKSRVPSTNVMFFGEQDGLRVCLTGSVHHVLGAAPQPSIDGGFYPGSFTVEPPSYYAYLFNDISSAEQFEASPERWDMQQLAGEYHEGIYHFTSGVSTENLSFVARVISRWGEDPRYLLGSPIWVSVSAP
jgi:hypothetical protein